MVMVRVRPQGSLGRLPVRVRVRVMVRVRAKG